MSHNYKMRVGDLTVAISVNSDWSGYARVSAWETQKHPGRRVQALCDAQRLLVGVVDGVSPEAGEFLPSDWPLVVALAVRSNFKSRAETAIADIADVMALNDVRTNVP